MCAETSCTLQCVEKACLKWNRLVKVYTDIYRKGNFIFTLRSAIFTPSLNHVACININDVIVTKEKLRISINISLRYLPLAQNYVITLQIQQMQPTCSHKVNSKEYCLPTSRLPSTIFNYKWWEWYCKESLHFSKAVMPEESNDDWSYNFCLSIQRMQPTCSPLL